jgi:hypothetical protein
MKSMIFLSCLLFMSLTISSVDVGQNEVKGKITMSDCSENFRKGDGYNKDGTEIMQSNDPLAHPSMNVIISLHPLDFKPKLELTQDAYITQTEQTFVPHILPVVVGSKVHFLNEDEFFHNVRSYSKNSKFTIGRRAPGISYSVKIKKIGEVNLMCDIHSHMNARILSFDTPYFCRINQDGTYSIKNLPDGKYQLKVFHPTCENKSQEISIKGGKVFEFDFKISNRS